MSAGDGRRQIWVEWISVKDRLPPCAELVLVYAGGKRLRAFRLCQFAPVCPFGSPGEEGWYEGTAYGVKQPLIKAEVTHWMELPPGPEGA